MLKRPIWYHLDAFFQSHIKHIYLPGRSEPIAILNPFSAKPPSNKSSISISTTFIPEEKREAQFHQLYEKVKAEAGGGFVARVDMDAPKPRYNKKYTEEENYKQLKKEETEITFAIQFQYLEAHEKGLRCLQELYGLEDVFVVST